MLDANTDYAIAEAVEIVFPPDVDGNEVAYRRWTGAGTWTYQGKDYSAGGIVEIGDIQQGATLAEAMSISLALVSDADRTLFLNHDPGPSACRIWDLWRKRPKGGAWPAWTVTESYAGSLSTPRYSDGELSIDIQRVFDDVWRGVPLRWVGSDQRRRFPGDTGLDRADRIRRSGILVATT